MSTVFCMQDPNTYGTPDTEEQAIWEDKVYELFDVHNATYIGNNKTRVYHKKDCYCKHQILPQNLEPINHNGEDKNGRKYTPCGHCLVTEQTIKDWINKVEKTRQEKLEVKP